MHCQCKGNQARNINTPCLPHTQALQPGLHPNYYWDAVTFWLSLTAWVTANLWDVLLEKFPSESSHSNSCCLLQGKETLQITWGFTQNLLVTLSWFPQQSSDTSAQLAQTDRACLATRVGTWGCPRHFTSVSLPKKAYCTQLHGDSGHLTANWTQFQALKLPEKWTSGQRTVDTTSPTTSFCLTYVLSDK